MTDAFVLGGVRTPIGRYGGPLSHIRTDELLGHTLVWACERVGVELDRVKGMPAGCVNPELAASKGNSGRRMRSCWPPGRSSRAGSYSQLWSR